MTIESTGATAAPDLPTPVDCPECGFGLEHDPSCPRAQPSPSTGGEPATDSAGQLKILTMTSGPFGIRSHKELFEFKEGESSPRFVANVPNEDDAQRLADGWNRAAREPAPVARELDVEAERLQRHGAHLFSTCKGLGWKDGGEGAVEFLMHTAYATGKEDAARQATAESAPASAAPLNDRK